LIFVSVFVTTVRPETCSVGGVTDSTVPRNSTRRPAGAGDVAGVGDVLGVAEGLGVGEADGDDGPPFEASVAVAPGTSEGEVVVVVDELHPAAARSTATAGRQTSTRKVAFIETSFEKRPGGSAGPAGRGLRSSAPPSHPGFALSRSGWGPFGALVIQTGS
jgi:hypothetical protein